MNIDVLIFAEESQFIKPYYEIAIIRCVNILLQ